jgi:hypothetical protein
MAMPPHFAEDHRPKALCRLPLRIRCGGRRFTFDRPKRPALDPEVRCAVSVDVSPQTFLVRTLSLQNFALENKSALSAWFWVDALTLALTASAERNAVISASPISIG